MAAQALIFLDYTFLFDTNTTFAHLYEFERILTQFLDSRQLQAEVIKSVEGAPSKRVMFITKKEVPVGIEPIKAPVGRPQTLRGKIKELSDRKFRKPAVEFMKGKK